MGHNPTFLFLKGNFAMLYFDIYKKLKNFEINMSMKTDKGVTAFLGSSGSGKTLTLKCIAGIEIPDRGIIKLNGVTVFDSEKKINISPQKRKVGYLFQNYALFPNMTVYDNIDIVVSSLNKKITKIEKKQIINEILESLQINHISKNYPQNISGGQQQRVALARILVSNPSILLLDEPFSALDSGLKEIVEKEILQILSKIESTTILVTHDVNEAYRISNNVALIESGNIKNYDTKENIFNNYFTKEIKTVFRKRV